MFGDMFFYLRSRRNILLVDAALFCFRLCKKWDASASMFVDRLVKGQLHVVISL